MLENPNAVALAVGTHLANDILQVIAPRPGKEVRQGFVEAVGPARPICLDDTGWCDHYGHRHLDVDVERL
ncbi:hypothetical protein [Paramagnetospirillum kuznetsovii]|uniref:hypothetical protein n=1 Tax=Paramagnetospirillum kuznetsovii TaxID=2053833 RepID=UPI0011BD86E0|nr:hypothetical protein [Paramagnetospirillum kuznetsovii]